MEKSKTTGAPKKREVETTFIQTNNRVPKKVKSLEKGKIKKSKEPLKATAKIIKLNDKSHKVTRTPEAEVLMKEDKYDDQNESSSDNDDYYLPQNHEDNDSQNGEYLGDSKISLRNKKTPFERNLEAQESDPSQSQKFKIIAENSSNGEDSSDDDNRPDDLFADNVPIIPLDPKDEKNLKKRLEELTDKGLGTKRGVIYLGRIPHGFYEEEMRAYFSQFGTVTRLRLSRNKKTGKSKHYAFIEFASEEVAHIVAETMNNYLLYESLLQCKVVPLEQVHENLWIGANKKFVPENYIKTAAQVHNRKRTKDEKILQNQKLLKKDAKRRRKLQELGIDYEFPGYTVQPRPKATQGKHIVYDEASEDD